MLESKGLGLFHPDYSWLSGSSTGMRTTNLTRAGEELPRILQVRNFSSFFEMENLWDMPTVGIVSDEKVRGQDTFGFQITGIFSTKIAVGVEVSDKAESSVRITSYYPNENNFIWSQHGNDLEDVWEFVKESYGIG
ncbi:hypothetical protein AKJ65_08170 [candidate division MSBL1 archaeon SCGC-AAA259E19]|uniref:Uncharacterized protein n=1 Tax=candidate division MSBL1 archaeon SCGC-AAA259E19 TaxID=1698264 RepID=A0A133UCW0_9EURY|nr:hypothetical protein AKJ65_08170 [candidate division MSBL1 archaeon SCGC-AAA259E19]